MIGIGLGILWVGYAAFSVGRVNAKGFTVTFSDMVLPSRRASGLAAVKGAALGLNQNLLGPATNQALGK